MQANLAAAAAQYSASVLLVEDEVLIRTLLAEELRADGLCVIEAANADEAWDLVQSDAGIGLVFSDVNMPGSMDGLELARRIKSQYRDLEIIVTSGNLGPRKGDDSGMFIPKPYRIEQVMELILNKLGERPMPA